MMFTNPSDSIRYAKEKLYSKGVEVFSGRWQSIDIDQSMMELLNRSIQYCLMKHGLQQLKK